ncbi:ATP-binding protein [Streptomyces sp. RP5T]|nr:ATP-binding protein [Streptomyces sp. RP5T]
MLMMGAAGAGKSTLAGPLAAVTGAVVVSYDAHQRQLAGDTGTEAVSALALQRAWRELARHCAAGTPTVVDGTHCQPERREMARAIAAAHGLETVLLVLWSPWRCAWRDRACGSAASRKRTCSASMRRSRRRCPCWPARDTRP